MAAPATRQTRGPKRSSTTPTGICTAAKKKKNVLDNSPTSTGESASSAARLGAMTPTELRKNWLTM
jgi:hypothetical protein